MNFVGRQIFKSERGIQTYVHISAAAERMRSVAANVVKKTAEIVVFPICLHYNLHF
jgi:hypothetical protein